MYTLNKIVDLFREFQQAHNQLNDFFFQPVRQIDAQPQLYPLLWTDILSDTVNSNSDGFEFDVIIADLVKEGERNLQDVWSDTNLIAKDFVYWLRNSSFTEYLSVEESVTLKPFQKGFTDHSAGWRLTIKIKTFVDWDLCGIPQRG